MSGKYLHLLMLCLLNQSCVFIWILKGPLCSNSAKTSYLIHFLLIYYSKTVKYFNN